VVDVTAAARRYHRLTLRVAFYVKRFYALSKKFTLLKRNIKLFSFAGFEEDLINEKKTP